jgi:hypothetical protein
MNAGAAKAWSTSGDRADLTGSLGSRRPKARALAARAGLIEKTALGKGVPSRGLARYASPRRVDFVPLRGPVEGAGGVRDGPRAAGCNRWLHRGFILCCLV